MTGYVEAQTPQCLLFEHGAEFINIRLNEDSTQTDFSITRKGFETKEQREKTWEKYRQGPPVDERFPIFTFDFYSTSKPEKIESIEKLLCQSLEEFRENDGNGMGSILFFFQKQSDGSYLMWDDIAFWEYE